MCPSSELSRLSVSHQKNPSLARSSAIQLSLPRPTHPITHRQTSPSRGRPHPARQPPPTKSPPEPPRLPSHRHRHHGRPPTRRRPAERLQHRQRHQRPARHPRQGAPPIARGPSASCSPGQVTVLRRLPCRSTSRSSTSWSCSRSPMAPRSRARSSRSEVRPPPPGPADILTHADLCVQATEPSSRYHRRDAPSPRSS